MSSDSSDLKNQLGAAEARLEALEGTRASLMDEIHELRAQIKATDAAVPSPPSVGTFSTAEKIALFADLFRGRADVFARRWENPRKATAGYAPACANEWVRGVCEKPRVRCGSCPNQAFIPADAMALRAHLMGDVVMGVYPLLPDGRCWFLAVDFDGEGWQGDVAAFVETCAQVGVPVSVERSRSGNGAHVWIFFAAPVLAVDARRMGTHLLSQTMSARHELSMQSYDRLFPNQDHVPRGGFGNLIALPFQGGAREEGNSVFVDQAWEPYADQWGFLAAVERMDPARVMSLAGESVSAPAGSLPATPWDPTVALPDRVNATLSGRLVVDTADLPSPFIGRIKRLAAFQNPEFYRKQSFRLSTALTPRVISCAEDVPGGVALPRGCIDELRALLEEHGVELVVAEDREDGSELSADFCGQLSALQMRAVAAVVEHEMGVLVAPPGAGKTVMGTHLIATRGRNTLVMVHRTQLVDQWRAQLAAFLDLEPGAVGQIGGGKKRPNGRLDVAMIQSLVRKGEVDPRVATYGHVVVDECHHVPAVSFERVMRAVRARFVTGLTATPIRRDGHHPILHFQLGPTRFQIEPRHQALERVMERRLVIRETAFTCGDVIGDLRIQDVYRRMVDDPDRNALIVADVRQAVAAGRNVVVLTERKAHLDRLAVALEGTPNLVVLQGGMGSRKLAAAIDRLRSVPEDESRLLLATGRFIGEGFDDARLDTLFLAMPVSWKGTLVQYAGRLHRRHDAKTDVRVVDYVDSRVPMLARMFEKRRRGYAAMGYG